MDKLELLILQLIDNASKRKGLLDKLWLREINPENKDLLDQLWELEAKNEEMRSELLRLLIRRQKQRKKRNHD